MTTQTVDKPKTNNSLLPAAGAGLVTFATLAGVGRNALRNFNADKYLQDDKLRNATVAVINEITDKAANFTGTLVTDNSLDPIRIQNIGEIAKQTATSTAQEVRKAANRVNFFTGGVEESVLKQVDKTFPTGTHVLQSTMEKLSVLGKNQKLALFAGSAALAIVAGIVTHQLLQPKNTVDTPDLQGRIQDKSIVFANER
jgi:hypothetical protein